MASRSLGSLTIDLIAKTGLFQEGLDKGGRAAQKFASDVERQARSVEASFDKAFKAVGVAAVAGLGAVSLAVKSSISDMYQLVTYSKQVAMPVDQFTAYAAAANDAEVQTEDFMTAMRTLLRNLQNAQLGSTRIEAMFKSLNIDPSKIKTGSQALEAMANAFSHYKDDANKAAIATQLMGRSGAAMIPLLDQGSDAIKAQAKHMRDLGVAFGQDGADKLSTLDDAMDEFHNTVKGLTNTFALALVPTITDATKRVTEFIQAWNEDGGLKKFTDGLGTLISHLDEIATFFVTRFVAAKVIAGIAAIGEAATVAGTAVGVLRVALAAVGGVFGLVATAVAALVVGFYNYSKQVNPAAQSTDDLRKAVEQMQQADKDAIGPATAHAKAVLKIAQANLVAANAELTRLQQVSEAAEQARQKYGDASIQRGPHPDVVIGPDGKFAPGGFTNQQDMQKRIAAQRKLVADLQTQINAATKSLDTRGLFAGLGSNGPEAPSIKIFDPNAAKKAQDALDKLTSSYDALAKASNQYANSLTADDPLQKANDAMAAGVENLAKLQDAYVKAGGSAKVAQELFDKGLAGLKEKFTFDLGEPQRQLDAYTASLDDQLTALKASNDVRIQSMTLGDHEAQNLQQLAQAQQEATKAITDFVEAHQLHPEAMSEDMYQKELAALKQHNADKLAAIKDFQDQADAMRGNFDAGWQKGIADFIEQTNDKFQQGAKFAQDFTSGFVDAFVEFGTRAKDAKEAFGDFIDTLYADALRFVANAAIKEFFEYLQGDNNGTGTSGGGTSTGGWGGLVNAFASFFGGGRAGGGPVAAGGLYQVNENGPELLAVGGRQYLMMGPQSGTVQPASRSRAPGGTTNYIMVQPTTTRRTADQIATAIDRRQRIATARNG